MRARHLLFGTAAAIALLAAAPVQADPWDGGGYRRGHEWRQHEWRRHEWREHERRHEWRSPYVYGYPPPVIYAPRPYYYGY
jgi:hypothetical protein